MHAFVATAPAVCREIAATEDGAVSALEQQAIESPGEPHPPMTSRMASSVPATYGPAPDPAS